jgi:hypothetical protein
MSSNKNDSAATADAQSIRVEPGERVILSPESQRFKESYRQVRPRTADEVREIIGLSAETAKALREQGVCCQPSANFSATVPAEELDSPDDAVRARAWDITYKALNNYVYSANPASLAQMKPAIERFLEISDAVLNIVVLNDIVVADGGTVEILKATDLVTANKIIIHKTGKIVCRGSTKFTVTSFEGT